MSYFINQFLWKTERELSKCTNGDGYDSWWTWIVKVMQRDTGCGKVGGDEVVGAVDECQADLLTVS